MSRSTAWDVRNRRFFDARGPINSAPITSRLTILAIRSAMLAEKGV